MYRGLWTIVATAVAVGTGIVIGEQLRGQAAAERPRSVTPQGPDFQLAQVDSPAPGTGGQPFPRSVSPGAGLGGGIVPEVIRGTIQSIDMAHSRIVVTPDQAGAPTQSIQVTEETRIVHQTSASVGDLKTGDTIQVTGQPLQINVSDIRIDTTGTAGGGRAVSTAAGPLPPPKGFPAPAPPSQPPTPPPPVRASVRGKISSLHPLKIGVGDGLECVLNMKQGATVARISIAGLHDLKPGETLSGFGQPGRDGALSATTLRVGFPPGEAGFMVGRPGGGGGGFAR
jgi:hypothetical protein